MNKLNFLVDVRRGFNFDNKKWIGTNAPYVEVIIDSQSQKTHYVNDLANPIWNTVLKFEVDHVPKHIEFRVKDDRLVSLLEPSLGNYIFNIDEKYFNQSLDQPTIIYDGLVELENSHEARLDVKITMLSASIKEVNSNEFHTSEYINRPLTDILDEHKITTINQDIKTVEIHTLPTIHVKEKPIIIEKEIVYEKPIEIQQTIVHQVKPIIVEQPIIKEKHEHFREAPQIIKSEEQVITETISPEALVQTEQQVLAELTAQRLAEHRDMTPIVHQEKEHVQLQPEVHVKPEQIHETEIVYQQPVEIERVEIEKIQPKVVENIKVEQEHIHQKLPLEIQSQEAKTIFEGDKYYSHEPTNLNPSLDDISLKTQSFSYTPSLSKDSRTLSQRQANMDIIQ